MSSNNTNNTGAPSTFGQLNWNISQDTSLSLQNITNYFNCGGIFLEIFVIIFLVVNFCIKKSTFRQPYFVIYTMGCFVDAVPKFNTFINQYIVFGNIVFYYTILPLDWYNKNFMTLCNLILALNRFSAIVFPLHFSRIWTKRKTAVICILMALYPFIAHCYNPLLIYYSVTRNSRPATVVDTDFEYFFGFFSDIAYAILATSAGVTAAVNMMVQDKMKNKNVERVLLAQSLISSIFLVFSTTAAWLASVNKYTSAVTYAPEVMRLLALQRFFINFSKLFYSFHQYIGLILLVTMSKNFREKFFEFYRLNILYKRVRTIYKSDVTTVKVINTSMATTTASKKSTLFRNFSTSY